MLDDGNQGWACLSSAPGLGKTLLRTVLHRSLDTSRYLGVSIENSLLDFDQLLLEIISQISGERAYGSDFPDRYSRLAEFKLLLTEQVVQSGRHLVLFLDEAQDFEKKTLDNLRNLSNICAEQANLMSIILIGVWTQCFVVCQRSVSEWQFGQISCRWTSSKPVPMYSIVFKLLEASSFCLLKTMTCRACTGFRAAFPGK